MKRLWIAAVLTLGLVAPAAAGDVYVKGYTKKDGTYVAPHHRSSPNNTTSDNYSVRGNPYTGAPPAQQAKPSYFVAPKPAAPSGATAQCNDGTYSYSQSASGTCSYHGGVQTWL